MITKYFKGIILSSLIIAGSFTTPVQAIDWSKIGKIALSSCIALPLQLSIGGDINRKVASYLPAILGFNSFGASIVSGIVISELTKLIMKSPSILAKDSGLIKEKNPKNEKDSILSLLIPWQSDRIGTLRRSQFQGIRPDSIKEQEKANERPEKDQNLSNNANIQLVKKSLEPAQNNNSESIVRAEKENNSEKKSIPTKKVSLSSWILPKFIRKNSVVQGADEFIQWWYGLPSIVKADGYDWFAWALNRGLGKVFNA